MFLNGSILEAYFFEKSICTEFVALGHVFGCFLLCLQDSMFETPSSSYSEIVPMPTSDIEYIFCWIKNPKVLAPHPKTCPQKKIDLSEMHIQFFRMSFWMPQSTRCLHICPLYIFAKQFSHRWYLYGSKYWWNQPLAAWFRAKSTTLFFFCVFRKPFAGYLCMAVFLEGWGD